MPSTLGWLDHDSDARDRMERVLALFEERDTVDELGLGAIRDAFADRLFPGTSTIQTRLRYFLFVPWVYREVERREVSSREAATVGRDLEHRLTVSLLEAEDTDGVFGKEAGRKLKRLASQVYWNGLGVWGIRTFDGSRKRYLGALDAIYRRRARLAGDGDSRDQVVPPSVRTWHAGLPEPPDGFPDAEGLTLELTREEAEYLQDRVQETQPGSYLAVLFLRAEPADAQFPWQHPIWSELGDTHREVLEHARIFSKVAEGAALLYNLLLARKDDRPDRIAEYEEGLREWELSLDRAELETWSLGRLWELTEDQGHTITFRARRFVRSWVERCRSGARLADDREAAAIVREREERLKGARSRFENPSALDRWGGASGLGLFDYRWPEVSTYLEDLHTGLEAS